MSGAATLENRLVASRTVRPRLPCGPADMSAHVDCARMRTALPTCHSLRLEATNVTHVEWVQNHGLSSQWTQLSQEKQCPLTPHRGGMSLPRMKGARRETTGGR